MAKENKFGPMELSIPVVGAKIKSKVMVNSFMQIKMNTKVNSMLIGLMVMENMFKNAVKRMRAIGQMTNHMDREN